MEKIKPCPFCGNDTVLRSNGEYQYYVRCMNPKCSVYVATYIEDTPIKAISAWNHRKGERYGTD